MAPEDQTQKCSNSSGGGGRVGNIVRSSKKKKPKKVPQRGLGVAQLERIRLEEQQMKDYASSSSTVQLPSSATKSSNPEPYSSSSVVQNIEILNPNSSSTVPLTNSLGRGHAGDVHKLYNSCDFNLEKESSAVDQRFNFRSNLNLLPYESIPFWPLPSLIHKAQQFQHPSSTVYESSATSSSSVLNFQIEPPSNQSYYSNYPRLWTEEEKMVGMKRPYPFSQDHPRGFSSSQYKVPPIVHNHPRVSRSEDSASCGTGHTLFFKPDNTISRDGFSCSNFMLEPNNSKKNIKENGVLNGGFLTLAPPQGSKVKHFPHFLAFSNSAFPDFESLPSQGSVEDQIHRSGPNQRQPYYSFFPQSMAQARQAASTMNNCNNGGAGESVDLNLKL